MTHAKNRVRRLPALLTLAASALALFTLPAQAAVPGITPATTGVSFNLVAADAYTIQPDGATLYSWGYGCAAGSTPTFVASGSTGTCPTMQTPGPTLVVTEGQVITVTLANKLPKAAGNTSIVFPGFVVTATGGAAWRRKPHRLRP
jgi:FtsP/CotA-like multicopper oxidase with cupredoxin domain